MKNTKRILFASKAATLEVLAPLVTKSKVLKFFTFNAGEFKRDTGKVVKNINEIFPKTNLIIRSSSLTEDSEVESKAGQFKSILNISSDNTPPLQHAIENVIKSYDDDNPENEVLIQPMMANIKMGGVILTADLDTLAPYYVINYDEGGPSTSITSGNETDAHTYIHLKGAPITPKNKLLSVLISACQELECICRNNFLDIEFAFSNNEELYIFQVRPIIVKNKKNFSSLDLLDPLLKVYSKIKKLASPHPNLLGDKAIFGLMPDWNPAEIIGLKPKPLSLSLYKELITDNIWAYQRDNYGYNNLRSHPLMVSFLGIPYIDVRVDFNSFIPKSLNKRIAKKLVEYYLKKLIEVPTYHDKIEFEIVHSCYYLNLPENLRDLENYDFNENEIKRLEFSLLELTNKIINPEFGLYKKDINKIEILNKKYDDIVHSNISVVDKVFWLTEDCKRFGTLPFAGIARAAFIAVQFLKSFVHLDIISQEESDRFMNSLNTIAKQLNNDLYKVSANKISKNEFLQKYGHLRPGTYDILSLRYDENFENYFSELNCGKSDVSKFDFSENQLKMLDDALLEHGIDVNGAALIKFIKESIENRECSKFIFTKSLSRILVLIEEYGKRLDISKEDMSFLDFKVFLSLYATLDFRFARDIFLMDIEKNKESFNYTEAIRLPALLIEPEDVYSFNIPNESPTFITLNEIRAGIIREEHFSTGDFSGKIAFIKSADPGYDFLFTKNIAGLVTQFGGANSHMAIRCSELGLPAVIGAGEKKFNDWAKANLIEINCSSQQVRIIS